MSLALTVWAMAVFIDLAAVSELNRHRCTSPSRVENSTIVHPSRLETRTKESDPYASQRVFTKPLGETKVSSYVSRNHVDNNKARKIHCSTTLDPFLGSW